MEQETVKLLNVLRRIARAAGYAAWTKPGPDATQFCISQYNRVLARLGELEPAIKPLFTPLSDTASAEVVRLAARELVAYFETDEPGFEYRRGFRPRFYYGGCGSRARAPFTWSCD
jgi:hypothetical protein